MKLTIEGNCAAEILGLMDALLNKGQNINRLKELAKLYADQAAASASRADTAARNAEMAATDIKKKEM